MSFLFQYLWNLNYVTALEIFDFSGLKIESSLVIGYNTIQTEDMVDTLAEVFQFLIW